MTDFTLEVIETIKTIPFGKVLSYGDIANLCGAPKNSRQVSYILHSMSEKYNLPWHRVVNSHGKISLIGEKYSLQKKLLEAEGIIFNKEKIDFKNFRL